MSKKTDEAKKLIADGLKSIQQGFNKLFEVIDDLENPDAPGGLMADLIEKQKRGDFDKPPDRESKKEKA